MTNWGNRRVQTIFLHRTDLPPCADIQTSCRRVSEREPWRVRTLGPFAANSQKGRGMRFRQALTAAIATSTAFLLPTPAFAQAAGEASAVPDTSCGHDCLIGKVEGFIAALRAGDASRLHVTGNVRYAEND